MESRESLETLEALQARHRKEQRDLVSRITQKKKNATKKTRKGVVEECERLDSELKERQAHELAALGGENTGDLLVSEDEDDSKDAAPSNGVEKAVEALSISPAQSDSGTQPTSQEQNAPRKRPNRAKARLARRAEQQQAAVAQAAEEAANLPDLREQERTQMKGHFGRYGLQEKEIRADGHCLYAAIADQMDTRGLDLKPKIQPTIIGEENDLPSYKQVRHAAADFIAQNPDDFVGFMEDPLDVYLQKIRDTGEWGGHMELMALAKTYGVKINVLHGDGTINKIDSADDTANEEEQEIWLGYYKHSHGLGEHYNSLRKAP
ncbi:hypothetical protein BDV95DRAFT_494301 [Massariosphaeria phaeospora]|uniref:OTU domain-containing protein n=1 Tax=Massariosphaeria phaeospora TaxID=100035 RepID=A0A7C8M892_9PLEO|nr:hypothetical protein BDV95DRAFT_494301 [Massariosphaeria phaeospora]